MASASKSIPFAVPAQPLRSVQSVTQDQLAAIINLRQQIETLEKQLGEAQADVQSALEAGASVEPGRFRTSLKTIERRSVAWKAICERELGEPYCARVLAATRPDTFTHLVVTA
jgi:hypothetical protein